jgi:hypothetical protein
MSDAVNTTPDASEGNSPNGKPNPDLLWRIVGDEALLLDTASGNYFSLDPIGTEIWKRLNYGEAIDEIAPDIARRYGTDETRVRGDVDDLLIELRDAGAWL